MSYQKIFPFRRVSVDHMVRGTTRVWWQIEPLFKELGPHTFQLQVSKSGVANSADWENVGPPLTNAYVAYDPTWRLSGYTLSTHYRIKLTTAENVYVSQPAGCYGELNERDWVLAQEIIRKEQLRHKYVSTPGFLVKAMRFGKPCPRCRETLTQEVTDSYCPVCSGTGFEIGYYPPQPMQCWDLSLQTIQEEGDATSRGPTRDGAVVTARVIGFPALNKYDVWVNAASDERWIIDTIQVVAAMRNVPLVYQVKLHLAPFTDGIYTFEVGGEAADREPGVEFPTVGCGSVGVNHNYNGNDRYAYVSATGCPVIGADVYVFDKTTYDIAGAQTLKTAAVAKTSTTANGRWVQSVQLNPGNYVVLYEKTGEYGPDTELLTVVPPPPVAQTKTGVKPKPAVSAWPTKKDNDFWNI
jgi:hypothetical protein